MNNRNTPMLTIQKYIRRFLCYIPVYRFVVVCVGLPGRRGSIRGTADDAVGVHTGAFREMTLASERRADKEERLRRGCVG